MEPSTPQDQPRTRQPVPAVDVMTVLAALQDQLDDLTATVEAQQRTIDELTAARPADTPVGTAGGRAGPPVGTAGRRAGTAPPGPARPGTGRP